MVLLSVGLEYIREQIVCLQPSRPPDVPLVEREHCKLKLFQATTALELGAGRQIWSQHNFCPMIACDVIMVTVW